MRSYVSALLSIAIIGFAGQASAQSEARAGFDRNPEATIYRDTNFRGPAMAVHKSDGDVRLAWPVFSVRVTRGTWQLCSAPNFKGNCVTVSRNEGNLTGRFGRGNALRSIRPITTGPGNPGGGGGGGDAGQSLRGMAAEFYPRPMSGRSRILACSRGSATASCAAETADRFCRQQGWTASTREALETVSRQVYLADVLCTRTGR